ncbi:winged helix-turn-helix transcriptional regulator [bacterium]|nr:winged helix-turn-helix transcriptional regulator [bacterium]
MFTVSEIAENQKISVSLLRRIIANLEKTGIIKTIK